MYNINFIAYAWDKPNSQIYQSFLIPFAFFSLINNENSHVEIIVQDVKNFTKLFRDEIEQLKEANLLDRYGSYTNILKNWIKLLTLNNKIVNTPDKYKIKI